MFGKTGNIGISVSDTSIEIIEIKPAQSGLFSLSEFAYADLDQGIIEHGKLLDIDRFSVVLKNMYEKSGAKFSTKNVYFIIPDPITFFHTFVFPGALPDKEIPNALSFKFEETFPIQSSDVQGDYAVVLRNPEKTIVQYAVTSRSIVTNYIEGLKKAGFSVDGMGLEAQAILRVVLGEPREKKASLTAYITEESATFFVRDILGLNSTFYATFKGFEDSREKIVMEEINSIFHWYKKNFLENDIDVIVLCGNSVHGLKTRLEKDYPDANIRIADVFGKVTNKEGNKNIEKFSGKASFLVALGGSLQDLVECGRKFELMPGGRCSPTVVKSKFITSAGDKDIEFGSKGVSLYLSGMTQKKKIGIAIGFILLCVVFLGGAYYLYNLNNEKINAEIERLNNSHNLVPTAQSAQTPEATGTGSGQSTDLPTN